ncbi:LacI family DNA-binding transcriptional regulator [Listeria ilorinensis]|uniref:LacI family DNA-binding transcriptional regulator n=1 Tax=Listeria ilorinensis TaxID=2867439 RepID=UPI001EF5F24D|nr:LacI family DNA-binding transcriptional regulator [Listeria ilorinensis]
MVGIKEIAKKAGVSISTVSYALNGSSKVTEKTRNKIIAVAEELNYTPNMAARSLKRRETNIIGIYLTDYSGAFYGEMLNGVTQTLVANGYELIVCSGAQSHRFLPERMIDGAIILDYSFSTEEILEYANRGHKMVVLDREIEHPNIRTVLLDNQAGSILAVDHLRHGFKGDFYLVTGPKGTYDSDERLKAAQSELSRFKDQNVYVIQGDFSKEAGRAAAERITREWKHQVAVFAMNDETAIGMYDYFKHTELVIGRDVRIVGFDNIEIVKYLDPKLTTIGYSKYRRGAVAAENLIHLLKGEEVHRRDMIYTTLIAGKST